MNDKHADDIDMCGSCFRKVFENEQVAASMYRIRFRNLILLRNSMKIQRFRHCFKKAVDKNGLSESREKILAMKMKLPPFHQKRRNLRKKSA